ncbi:MAG: hypothetical protein GVY29_08705 [Spirochaetes bacterium]|nr:hypothetical protein [Spirochaetota bacterium]
MSDHVDGDVKEHFAGNSEVTVAEGRGAQGLKHGKKMFAMFYKAELIEQGVGRPYDPGIGSPIKDRVLIRHARHNRVAAHVGYGNLEVVPADRGRDGVGDLFQGEKRHLGVAGSDGARASEGCGIGTAFGLPWSGLEAEDLEAIDPPEL